MGKRQVGRRTLLSEAELASLLPSGWTGDTRQISREWTFASYQAGVDFALRVAHAAEAADHHPDLLIGSVADRSSSGHPRKAPDDLHFPCPPLLVSRSAWGEGKGIFTHQFLTAACA